MVSVGALVISMLAWTNRVEPPEDGSICDTLTFVSRAEWGARPPKKPPVHIGHPVNMSFIHHSDTPLECKDKQSCSKQVRSIQRFHMDDRGWNDIGYSFLTGGDGRIYVGRGWDIVGSHTFGYNTIALGFCLIGNYSAHVPDEAATSATMTLLKCGIEMGHMIASYELFGHRDGGCTECPGNALYKLIQSWPNFSRRKIPKRCP